ncbi:acyl-CoA carboxylase epsilon subunit-like protein [Antricoccus suffuscus]|uniref:Acyl-CoA carboxylase epsilon subunit-like protein n=1 Tax=Antricoccus suffuscus TaxID=1629062 RepID=A0A2T0ZC50_9ACTN|nr:acyl-CoA carboxylase subunit epsilon [Antricoccus suffuscus]PRZ33881.1 acyl-CoA carboxylase epsilon subunit-like protein [Antricoccus suffuscus]
MTEEVTPHDDASPAPGPAFRIVSGEPTDEELAALTVVLLAAASGDEPAAPKRVAGSWADPAHLARVPVRHGIGGWRAGALP